MEENKNIDHLKQQGWEQMASLLDEHMPEDKKPLIGWYWVAGAAALVLALAIPFTMLMNDDSVEHTSLVDQDLQMPLNDQEVTPQIKDKSAVNNIASRSPKSGMAAKSTGSDAQAGSIGSHDPANKQNRVIRKETIWTHDRTPSEIQSKRVATSSDGIVGYGRVENPDHSVPGHEIARLDRPSYLVKSARQYLIPMVNDEHKIKIVPQSSGKIYASVFSEMMWSVSDRFGFVNAGPDVKYDFGKWTLGISGGLAMPLPREKSFYASNLPFSNQYNFTNKQYEKLDAVFSNSSGSVYYENYSMKPGFIVSLSARHQLTTRWGLGVDVGRIGFRYDFTQKAKPNQIIAANTDLSNLQNNLWYSGLSVHYQIGKQWRFLGGARMINVFDAGEFGILPAVRVEYGF